MATIAAQVLPDIGGNGAVQRISWEGLNTTDTVGAGVRISKWQDRSVQVVGTFGAGGTITIQGSNDGGTTWATLNDPSSTALTFTSSRLEQILELAELIRPSLSGGDGTTDLDIYIHMRADRYQ